MKLPRTYIPDDDSITVRLAGMIQIRFVDTPPDNGEPEIGSLLLYTEEARKLWEALGIELVASGKDMGPAMERVRKVGASRKQDLIDEGVSPGGGIAAVEPSDQGEGS